MPEERFEKDSLNDSRRTILTIALCIFNILTSGNFCIMPTYVLEKKNTGNFLVPFKISNITVNLS